MTTVTQGRFSLGVDVGSATAPASAGELVVADAPGPARRAGQWALTNGGPIVASATAVAGTTAAVVYGPSELAFVGAAVLSAAAAGVAAARLLTARTTTTACLSAFAGLAGVAAVAAVGAIGTVSSGKAELVQARSYVESQIAALTTERAALDADRASRERVFGQQEQAIKTQHAALTTQLTALEAQRQGLVTDRQTLSAEKAAFDQAVQAAAAKLAAPEREALATATSALEAERNSAVDARLAALAAEGRQLSFNQIKVIESAIDAFSATREKHNVMRIVAEVHTGNATSLVTQRTIPSDKVIATLVARGHVYVGPASSDRDNYWVVTPASATRVTTIAQLCELLHLGTGRDVPGPR